MQGYKHRYRRSWDEKAKTCAPEPTPLSSITSNFLKEKGLTEIQKKLFILYEHWDMVLGDYLAPLALPIGHRGKILLVAVEDNIVMSELTYSCQEILDRVHTFLDMQYFEKIELHLLQNKKPLNQILSEINSNQEVKVELIRPENLGHLNLPEGKVRDAYLHYLSLFDKS